MSFKDIIKGYSAIILALLGIGIIGLYAGYRLEIPLLFTISGAFFGASLASLFGRIANLDLNDKISCSVKGILKTIPEYDKKIEHLRAIWHIYHVTQYKGKWIWRHSIYDFSKIYVPYNLYADVLVMHPTDGKEIKYSAEGKLKGGRLSITLKPETGDEPPTIFLFPHADSGYAQKFSGIVVVETWDHTQTINSAIITKNEDYKFDNKNTVFEDSFSSMDDEWYDLVTKNYGDFLFTRTLIKK